MAAIFPKIYPTGYNGDVTDFIVRVKADRSGATRFVTGSVAIASGTTLGAIVGLAPFSKGAKLATGASQILTPQLDSGTTCTWSFGFQYSDSSSAGANAATNTSAYASSDSHIQLAAGGLITIGASTVGTSAAGTGTTPQTIDLSGDGWFVLVLNGTLTNQASAAVQFSLGVTYDQSGVTN